MAFKRCRKNSHNSVGQKKLKEITNTHWHKNELEKTCK